TPPPATTSTCSRWPRCSPMCPVWAAGRTASCGRTGTAPTPCSWPCCAAAEPFAGPVRVRGRRRRSGGGGDAGAGGRRGGGDRGGGRAGRMQQRQQRQQREQRRGDD